MEFWVLDFLSEVEMDSNVWVAIATFCLAGSSLYISVSTNRQVRKNMEHQLRKQVESELAQRWVENFQNHVASYIAVCVKSEFYRDMKKPDEHKQPETLERIAFKRIAIELLLNYEDPEQNLLIDHLNNLSNCISKGKGKVAIAQARDDILLVLKSIIQNKIKSITH